jgi:hypothetical protein
LLKSSCNNAALTARPKLIVRNISITQPASPDKAEPYLFREGIYVNGQFSVVNAGSKRAEISESHCRVFWTRENNLPMRSPYEEDSPSNTAQGWNLSPGEHRKVPFCSDKPMDGQAMNIWQGQWNLYVMGYIQYVDNLNLTRRTAFCRQLRVLPDGSRCLVVKRHPDYEYAD